MIVIIYYNVSVKELTTIKYTMLTVKMIIKFLTVWIYVNIVDRKNRNFMQFFLLMLRIDLESYNL